MDMNINSGLLKKLRISKSWSQEQLAEEAGLSLRTVQRIESEGIASLQSRKAIAKALEIAPSTLDAESDSAVGEHAEPVTKIKKHHTFNPTSVAGYHSLNTLRLFLIGFWWLGMASSILQGVVLVVGGIFFWELTPLTALQSAGAGIISTVLLIVPTYLISLWAYRHAKRIAVVRPLREESVNFSNT